MGDAPHLDSMRRRIARALELNEGFQAVFIFGPIDDARDLASQSVADAARATGDPINLLWFVPELARPLGREKAGVRTVWVLDGGEDERSVVARLQQMNRRRDSMAVWPATTLVVLLRTEHSSLPAEHAPDLWSVRTISAAVDAVDSSSPDLSSWIARSDGAFKRRLEEQPDNRPRYANGTYRFGYKVTPTRELSSLSELRELMSGVRGWTGWRPWWVPTGSEAPYSAENDVLECWMVAKDVHFQDPAHSDFWRASRRGLFYLRRGYAEDSTKDLTPGKHLSLSLAVWRAGEALFHAQQIAEELVDGFGVVDFSATWSGLRQRTTTAWPERVWRHHDGDATRRESVSSSVSTDSTEIRDDLPAVVTRLLRPLYDAFLATLSESAVRSNVEEMQRRPPRR